MFLKGQEWEAHPWATSQEPRLSLQTQGHEVHTQDPGDLFCLQDRLAVSSLHSKGTVCGENVRNCCSSWGQLRSRGQLKSGNNWRNQGQLESGVTFPSTTESSSGTSLVSDDLLGGTRLCPAHLPYISLKHSL